MTEERLKQIEESFMDVEDRETLIKMAREMGVWIGDAEELDNDGLKREIDNGISVIRSNAFSKESREGNEMQEKNAVLDVLYGIKKQYVPKKEGMKEGFTEKLDEFFETVRYSDMPDFTGTEWFYTISIGTKGFSVDISRWDGDEQEMGVCAYATIFEQEVDLAQDDEMLVYAHEKDGFTVFA